MTLEQCAECGVDPGRQHEQGCKVARCLACGAQYLDCADYEYNECGEFGSVCSARCGITDEPLPDGMQVWTGLHPGVAECREWGWWEYEVEPGLWTSCDPGRPGAVEDLGRLEMAAACGDVGWDRTRERFVKVAP